MCLWEINGWNRGPEAFLGLILMVSEDPKSQLRVFLGLLRHKTDSIKKSKPKKASERSFHPVISPQTHSMILQGFKWPPGHLTRLMLSGVGHINPKNTFNWFSWASDAIRFKPENASGPLFHPVIPPNTFLRYCKGLSDPFLYWCHQFYAISTPKTPSIDSRNPQKPLKSSPKSLLDLCFMP